VGIVRERRVRKHGPRIPRRRAVARV
jgi:hypothetical protein